MNLLLNGMTSSVFMQEPWHSFVSSKQCHTVQKGKVRWSTYYLHIDNADPAYYVTFMGSGSGGGGGIEQIYRLCSYTWIYVK